MQSITLVFCVIFLDFDISFFVEITSKVCTPEFESNKIYEDVSPTNKDVFFNARNEEFKWFFFAIRF